MSEIIDRFNVTDPSLSHQAFICAIVIWVIVVVCSIMSIVGQPFSKKQRMFWMVVVMGLPLVGLLSYLPFSIRKENYPGLFKGKK